MQSISEHFISELREYVASLPFVDGLIQYDMLIKGLVVYGTNLSIESYEKVMNVPGFIEYKQMVINWVAFLEANPEYQYEYQGRIRKVFINTLTYDYWKRENTIKYKEYREIRRLAKRLPDINVLTDSFISMNLFVKFGINLFGLRASKYGIIIRNILKVMKKKV